MATYKNLFKGVTVGQVNSDYEKIYNCRVIEPTYEKGKGLHNEEIMLDKRLGMLPYHKHEQMEFTDDIVIDDRRYYLYNDYKFSIENGYNNPKCYVGVETENGIEDICGGFPIDEYSPIKFALGRGAKGEIKEDNIELEDVKEGEVEEEDEEGNLVKVKTGYIHLYVGEGRDIKAGDYVYFQRSNALINGATIEIEDYKDGYIYVLGVNLMGSVPNIGDMVDIFEKSGSIPVIGTKFGVIAIHVNKNRNVATFSNIFDISKDGSLSVVDVVNFNGNLFVLLNNNVVYYSRQTLDDNLQFYSARDRKFIEGAEKLVPFGKLLIVFADDNRIISPINQVTESDDYNYAFYPLNYNGKLYSKYSYVYINNALYIFQSDKKFFNVNINNVNVTDFDIILDEVTNTVRGIFSEVGNYVYEEDKGTYDNSKGEIYMNVDYNSTVIHMFYHKQDGSTIEFEYDNNFKHWLLHTYDFKIYKKTNRYLCKGYVNNIGGYKDLDKEYKQEINYFIYNAGQVIQVGFIDMMMGLIKGEKLLYNLDVEVESLRSRKEKHRKIKDNTFDTLPFDHSLDYAIIHNDGRGNQHYGNIASIRRFIMEAGRMFRVSINGYNRFIYGNSNIVYKEGNPFVHEIENSF